MVFHFGIMESIQPGVGTISFIAVVSFLIMFEYLTQLIDYMQDFYPSSYLMIQKIYKELMIMGIVSFSVLMVGASMSADNWIEAVDFAHILVFFTALFFVVHAFFLILLSASLSKTYQRIHHTHIKSILKKIEEDKSWWGKFLNNRLAAYIPGAKLRSYTEFKILHALFRDTYHLPLSFNFSGYLIGCHEKYALELLDIGAFSWMSLIFLSVINLVRVVITEEITGNNCTPMSLNRMLRQSSDVKESSQLWLHTSSSRLLFLSSEPYNCSGSSINNFIASGYLLCTWAIILTVIARTYELR